MPATRLLLLLSSEAPPDLVSSTAPLLLWRAPGKASCMESDLKNRCTLIFDLLLTSRAGLYHEQDSGASYNCISGQVTNTNQTLEMQSCNVQAAIGPPGFFAVCCHGSGSHQSQLEGVDQRARGSAHLRAHPAAGFMCLMSKERHI